MVAPGQLPGPSFGGSNGPAVSGLKSFMGPQAGGKTNPANLTTKVRPVVPGSSTMTAGAKRKG
jgi:hypothetical protein